MKITVVYDNDAKKPGLKADWGFSCLIETVGGPSVLFDTGARGSILLGNMEPLGIDPGAVDIIAISHGHGDHTGGLASILAENDHAEIYLPASIAGDIPGRKVTRVGEPLKICEGVYSTGQLLRMEQSLALDTARGIVVVTGCSHPGVANILGAASAYGRIDGIIGGFHGFCEFDRLKGLSLIGPCHCTQYKAEIRRLFPDQCVECGAGLVLEL
ncbi:MAG: MBL fold metallo-hydrolase [Chloroflexota bacterium]